MQALWAKTAIAHNHYDFNSNSNSGSDKYGTAALS